MRIGFVVPQVYALFPPGARGPVGGSERQVYGLGRALADAGHAVQLCVPDAGQPALEQREGMTLVRSLRADENPLAATRAMTTALRRMESDVYVFRAASPGVPLAAAFVRSRLGRPAVYMLAHDAECRHTDLRRLLGRSCAAAMAAAYRIVSAVTAQTAHQADAFARHRGLRVAAVIPNAVEIPDAFPPAAGRRGALWVGRAVAFKQPELFVRLASRFPGVPFTMVAQRSLDSACEEALRTAAASVPNLRLLDYVPPGEVAALYASSAIAVLTSTAEGMPNTLLEAMAAGTPVLSLAVNPDGILDASGAGLCAGGDIESFRRLFGDLMAAPDRRERMGASSRAYVAQHFAPARVAGLFADTLAKIVRQQAG